MEPREASKALREALHGMNAPLHVQYVWQLAQQLPPSLVALPGSREYREAQRAFWAERGIVLDATRRDIEAGYRHLQRIGLLPTAFVRRFGPDA